MIGSRISRFNATEVPTGKRLLLVNPVSPAHAGLSHHLRGRFPPLGLGVIAGLTPENWDVEILDENWERFVFSPADLVGITAFTSSAPRAYAIAGVYRAKGIPVVMGSVHASMCDREALEHVDCVVIGEAESVWAQVLADHERGELQETYRGTLTDMANGPRPRHELFDKRYRATCVETSRGCPMDCGFCSVSAFNGKKSRARPVDEVLAELKTIPHPYVFFVDGNILGNTRDSRNRALALFRGLAEARLNKKWLCMASLNFGEDPELLGWAFRAGCRLVFIGIEAERTAVLAEVNKSLNLEIGLDKYENHFRRIQRAGIAVLGSFMLGMDGDDVDHMRARTRYMIRCGVDGIQVTVLTPLPGTRLYRRYQNENRLIHDHYPGDWALYDFLHVVHRPARMRSETLQAGMRQCCRRVYAWPVLVRKGLRALWRTRNEAACLAVWRSNVCYRRIVLNRSRRDGDGNDPLRKRASWRVSPRRRHGWGMQA